MRGRNLSNREWKVASDKDFDIGFEALIGGADRVCLANPRLPFFLPYCQLSKAICTTKVPPSTDNALHHLKDSRVSDRPDKSGME